MYVPRRRGLSFSLLSRLLSCYPDQQPLPEERLPATNFLSERSQGHSPRGGSPYQTWDLEDSTWYQRMPLSEDLLVLALRTSGDPSLAPCVKEGTRNHGDTTVSPPTPGAYTALTALIACVGGSKPTASPATRLLLSLSLQPKYRGMRAEMNLCWWIKRRTGAWKWPSNAVSETPNIPSDSPPDLAIFHHPSSRFISPSSPDIDYRSSTAVDQFTRNRVTCLCLHGTAICRWRAVPHYLSPAPRGLFVSGCASPLGQSVCCTAISALFWGIFKSNWLGPGEP